MRKLFLFFFLIAISVPALVHAGPLIEFERTGYDFGRVKQGRQLHHEFRFTNAGDEDLVIEGLKPS